MGKRQRLHWTLVFRELVRLPSVACATAPEAMNTRTAELDRLMQDPRRRKFDAVLVARFDRFARSVRHLVVALDEFGTLGIDFVSLTEH